MSKFFIERPILANVIAIVTIVLGVVCLLTLPVSEYPNIVPPTIQVTTNYPGASAATVASTVGIPLEQQINGVENAIYLPRATSSATARPAPSGGSSPTSSPRRPRRAVSTACSTTTRPRRRCSTI